MADIEKFIEEQKNLALYDARNQVNLSVEILNRNNNRTTPDMIRLILAGENIFHNWPERYKARFEGVASAIRFEYPYIDGWTVLRSIEAEGQRVLKENALDEQKKKKFLGLF